MEQFESIKSKERVKELGEVFTPEGIVKDMLNLIDTAEPKYKAEYGCEYTESLEKTFLEPSCGTGNFLVEIVARKCKTAVVKYKHSLQDDNDKEEFKVNLLKCVATVYGVDIMPDNIIESKSRVRKIVEKAYKEAFGISFRKDTGFTSALDYIIARNIILGNTLTNKMHDKTVQVNNLAKTEELEEISAVEMFNTNGANSKDLEFSEWEFESNLVKRTVYLAAAMDNEFHPYDSVNYTELSSVEDIEKEAQPIRG